LRAPRPSAAAVAAVLLASGAGAQETPAPVVPRAVLRGTVTIVREPSSLRVEPSISGLGMAAVPEAPDRRRSVVYLETAPQGAFEEPEQPPAIMDQRNQTFVPYVLAIPVGATVLFPNSDHVYHNVFSLSRAKRFDLGRYPTGQVRSVRFDRPGVVRVFCEIHSHMNAFVLVFAHRYFATTDDQDRYRIPGIPPGTYTVVVWNDGSERERRVVRIPEDAREISLDLTVH
jgi:plastocyanin